MTALALGLLIGAAGVVGRATAIEPGTTVDQSNVVQVKDLLPPEVYAHFKKGEYANKLFDFPNSRWSWDDGFAEATKWNAEHLVLDEHKSPIDKDTTSTASSSSGSTTRRGRGRGTGSSPGGASC